MAKFTVIWDETLEAHFTDMWTKSASETRALLTQFAAYVDNALSVDPDDKGEFRPEANGRVLEVPIAEAFAAVVYEVSSVDRKVVVTRFHFRREA
jgi:hypothetical protein